MMKEKDRMRKRFMKKRMRMKESELKEGGREWEKR